MKLDEYAGYDGLGLAALVRSGQVSPSELADTAQSAIDAVNPTLNAVIGLIEPRAPAADRSAPFFGVPFLIKDLVLHAEGVACDMGSRLVAGSFVSPHDTDLMRRFKSAGLVDSRPHQRAGIRVLQHDRAGALWSHPQSLGHWPLAGRLQRRIGRGGRRRHGAGRARQ